jgi:hypothetical protein
MPPQPYGPPPQQYYPQPFQPRAREPWINPAKRVTVGVIAGAAAILLLGGVAIGAAATGNDNGGGRSMQIRPIPDRGPNGYGYRLGPNRGRIVPPKAAPSSTPSTPPATSTPSPTPSSSHS